MVDGDRQMRQLSDFDKVRWTLCFALGIYCILNDRQDNTDGADMNCVAVNLSKLRNLHLKCREPTIYTINSGYHANKVQR